MILAAVTPRRSQIGQPAVQMILRYNRKSRYEFADSARNRCVQGKTELELTESSVAEDHLLLQCRRLSPFTRGLQSQLFGDVMNLAML